MKFSAAVVLTAILGLVHSSSVEAKENRRLECIEPGAEEEEPVASEPVLQRTSARVHGRKLQVCDTTGGSTGGDPHFLRWQQAKRDDFHGECDLVLFHKNNFLEQELGGDLRVHIRTKGVDAFSYIESSAIRVGEDTLEFAGHEVYVNGNRVRIPAENQLAFGKDFSVAMHYDAGNKNRRIFVVDLQTIQVTVKATKTFMTVSLGGDNKALKGSVGLLGKFGTGEMIARDGSLMEEFLQFGFEWQVIPEQDGQLFHDAREPQLPYEQCRMPTTAKATVRKLRQDNNALYEQALVACTSNHPENIESCVEDVMLSGDMDFADAW